MGQAAAREIWSLTAPALGAAVLGGAAALAADLTSVTLLGAAVGAVAGALVAGARQVPAAPGSDRPRPLPAPRPDDQHLPAGAGKLLLEKLPLGILLIDAGDRVRYINPAGRELFARCPPGAFHAAALRAPKLLAAVAESRAEGGPRSADFTLMRGGDLHLRAQVRALSGDGRGGAGTGPPVVVVIEDVTQARRSEELYRDFVANASHELRTPLASISGIIETLQGHARDDPAAAERFLQLMAVQAQRMTRLVDDMLSLNRIEQNERVMPREPQRIGEIVGEVVDAMRPIARAAGIALTAELPEPGTVVLGSRDELSQVFQNLVDNAIKYGRSGDSVTVEALPAEPGHVAVAVRDTGPGIPRTHLPRLTERFYRVSVPRSRARGGTGLGLAIVKHVLARHRGRLRIDSEVDGGSCFTVTLPVADATRPAVPDSEGS